MDLDIPDPGRAASRHSAALTDYIRQKIEASAGWISFADYMDLALYAPGYGYYSAGAVKFGEAGDFVTAPEISPLFSQCVANQCAQILDQLNDGVVLEPGAGQGTMAADILLELAKQDALPKQYLILEPSADLRNRQRITIKTRAGDLLEHVKWLSRPPEQPLQGVLIANEVIDALPVQRFVIDETQPNQLCELGVTWVDDALAWSTRPATGELLKRLVAILETPDFFPANGYTSEFCSRLPMWIETVADWLAEGAALLFDYGYSRSDYYRSDRQDGTLRCYYRHRATDDPFLWPGLQDITAWVDFTLLAESAVAAGLEVAGYTTQAQFLLAANISEKFESLEFTDSKAQIAAAHAMRRLVLPGEMGETVKVMMLSKGIATLPSGMSGRDLRASL